MKPAVITEQHLRELATFRGAPVVSIYLDLDGRRRIAPSDVEHAFTTLRRAAERQATSLEAPSRDAVEGLLDQVAVRVGEGFDRSSARGVALFASDGLFEVVEVPVPLHDQVVLDEQPALRQLQAALDEYEDFLVVLIDRQRGRLVRFRFGEVTDHSELYDEVPRRGDATDPGGLMASHVQQHADEVARRHFQRLARAVLEAVQQWEPRRVILGGPVEATAALEALLHPYVRERLAGRVNVPVWSSAEEVRRAAAEVQTAFERRHEHEVIEQIREGGPGRATAGLDATLQALYDGRVHVLVVSQALEADGAECTSCGHLWRTGGPCPACGGSTEPVIDLVSRAMDVALAGRGAVETCDDPELDELAGIGAILRF